jgi:hypothetical protein
MYINKVSYSEISNWIFPPLYYRLQLMSLAIAMFPICKLGTAGQVGMSDKTPRRREKN